MANNSGKKARRAASQSPDNSFLTKTEFREVKPLNYIQETYLNAIKTNEIVLVVQAQAKPTWLQVMLQVNCSTEG
jgi:phosphate starvation-inducible protein PhoH